MSDCKHYINLSAFSHLKTPKEDMHLYLWICGSCNFKQTADANPKRVLKADFESEGDSEEDDEREESENNNNNDNFETVQSRNNNNNNDNNNSNSNSNSNNNNFENNVSETGNELNLDGEEVRIIPGKPGHVWVIGSPFYFFLSTDGFTSSDRGRRNGRGRGGVRGRGRGSVRGRGRGGIRGRGRGGVRGRGGRGGHEGGGGRGGGGVPNRGRGGYRVPLTEMCMNFSYGNLIF